MNDVTYQVGQEDGRRFGDSLISQLANIAASRGVPLSGVGGTGGGATGSGPGARYQRAGGGPGRRGPTNSRGVGGGETYHAALEQPYTGEKVLGENVAGRDATDALQRLQPGAYDPNAVSAAAASARADDALQRLQPGAYGQDAASGAHPRGGSAETDAAIQEAAKAAGIDFNTMRAIASIESDMTPGSNRNRKTQYKGLYQIGRDEWKRFGSGDIYNAHDNAMATARMFASHREEFRNHFGREPTDKELYMIHQQGLGFFTRHAMTNIHGNRYPGMHGPQTNDSFMEGWGRELDRRKAAFGGEPHAQAPSNARVHVGEVTSAGGNQAGNHDTDYLSEHGGHSTTNRVEHPLGEDSGFNPELAARLAAAGRKFEAETGHKPTFGEGDRDDATQQFYWEDSHHGRDYAAARPGHSRHQSGAAMDVPFMGDRGEFGRWLGAGTGKGRAGEFGLHYPHGMHDRPHVEMDQRYKGDNFYNPNKTPDNSGAMTGPNGEMIVFGGLGGQLDRDSVARIAEAKGLTPRYYDYRDTEAALKHAKGLDRPYESMGFSAGVNSQERFAEEARKRGVQLPSHATSVGQYAPEGRKNRLAGNSGVPTDSYLDPSGKGLRGQVPEGHYFEGSHMPKQGDAGTMSRAADDIVDQINKKKQEQYYNSVGDKKELAQKNTNVLRPNAGRNSANKSLPDALKEHPGVGRSESSSQNTGEFLNLKGKLEAAAPRNSPTNDDSWNDHKVQRKPDDKA